MYKLLGELKLAAQLKNITPKNLNWIGEQNILIFMIDRINWPFDVYLTVFDVIKKLFSKLQKLITSKQYQIKLKKNTFQ